MVLQNDFVRQWKAIEQPVTAALRRVGSSGWYILGEEVRAFEAALASFWGVRHVVGTGNGMDALEIGLRCLDLQAGDKVLTTPLSAFASTLAIIRAGGVPVFVDVDQFGRIDLLQCGQLLERDSSIHFLLPVHLYGLPLPMRELMRLRDRFALSIVEDCAQSIGASDAGRLTGTVGQIAATSFYPTKNLGALGDGGAVLTNDAAWASRAKALRNYGQSALYVHGEVGMNSRLDELHAAILREALLPSLPVWTESRRSTAQEYLRRIDNPLIRMLRPEATMEPVWHIFPVLVAEQRRDHLRDHLRAAGITTSVHYPQIIPEQTALTKCGRYEIAVDPVQARQFAREELSLPIHPFLSQTEIETVIEACNNWKGLV